MVFQRARPSSPRRALLHSTHRDFVPSYNVGTSAHVIETASGQSRYGGFSTDFRYTNRDEHPLRNDTRRMSQTSDMSSISGAVSFVSNSSQNYKLRKKSLIKPERSRINRAHPNYHYRKHAKMMRVIPSTTGHDPCGYADHEESLPLTSNDTQNHQRRVNHGPGYLENHRRGHARNQPRRYRHQLPGKAIDNGKGNEKSAKLEEKKFPNAPDNGGGSSSGGTSNGHNRLKRKRSAKHEKLPQLQGANSNGSGKSKESESIRPPSLWSLYCAVITIWCPDAYLRFTGKVAKAQQRAWREKIGLISIILAICAMVGYLTFGFTETVCPSSTKIRLRVNDVSKGYMIFHGKAYDLSTSRHPAARGIPNNSNVLFDLPEKFGGKDGSFLFQNVNGACKGIITRANSSNIPMNSANEMAWYFPCRAFEPDGSSTPNFEIDDYLGKACHTSKSARLTFYNLKASGDVYYTWGDIKNSTRNLIVWGGDVLDLNLLAWLDRRQVSFPAEFDILRGNSYVKGRDMTPAFSSGREKQIARCLTEIIKVGSVDTATIGCIASRVVLYISLFFILSIVIVKFLLALAFQWFICRKFGASRTSLSPYSKKRLQEIEEWSDDINRSAARSASDVPVERNNRRTSAFFPTTSRFTSPYALERSLGGNNKPIPTTMTSQTSGNRLPAGNGNSAGTNGGGAGSQSKFSMDSRSSLVFSPNPPPLYDPRQSSGFILDNLDYYGTTGFISSDVVPQPPPEWEPFGYPLAHVICLVTAYSEGVEGLRTTLDSIAMTDYPNSHKLILVICDGMIKGHGETLMTPDIALSMLKNQVTPPELVQAYSYVAVASGSKRHNQAKIYSGFYDYGEDSSIPVYKQQRVPMIVVVKCGTSDEASNSKPGNRGKRDSQIILMGFLQKVMFDERMTELEFEMFNGILTITGGISPDFYEIVLMVDADTKLYPDSLTHMVSAMVKDPEIMGLCGETKIANKRQSWVTAIQVFEYFISHHLSKSFESVFGGVTCLPGCFCMYRIKAPKGGQNYWVPILANPDVVEHYSENVVDTLHKKNLLLLGEDRYLSTLMLKTFPKRKQIFVPQAVCKTTVPDKFRVLLSQRRRWINSTVHNLMELVLVRDLCGTFCFSMQFVVFIELLGTLVLPAAISFTIYLIALAIKAAITHTEAPVIPLILLAMILGLPGVLIVLTANQLSYVVYMFIYLLSLPIWNFVLPSYAYWKFDDFSWGETRKTAGEKSTKGGIENEGEFDSSKITMKRWADFHQERKYRFVTLQHTTNQLHQVQSTQLPLPPPISSWSGTPASLAAHLPSSATTTAPHSRPDRSNINPDWMFA